MKLRSGKIIKQPLPKVLEEKLNEDLSDLKALLANNEELAKELIKRKRLNDSWRNDRLVRRNLLNGQPDPNTLTNHERTFIDDMLGDMGQHYTQQSIPVTNAIFKQEEIQLI
jgi:hypothetical protein